jgi:hypothetical protein
VYISGSIIFKIESFEYIFKIVNEFIKKEKGDSMNIVVVGAGNIGLAMTAYISLKKKHNLYLFTNKDFLKDGLILLQDIEGEKEVYTDNFKVIDSAEEAFEQAELILCTYPAFLRKKFIEENGRYIKSGTKLGFIPGYGGAEFFCEDLIQRGVIIFGLQRVPYVARAKMTDNNITAAMLSKKKSLYCASIPYKYSSSIANLIGDLLDIPCFVLKEYLSITLAPSNPLLHITGLYNVFKNYNNGDVFDSQLKFYEEWNDDTSRLLFEYDKELQEICKALAPLDMSEVIPLPVYYESSTPEKMTKKLKSIKPFKAVMVPLVDREQGYTVDLKSRMFVEDYPFGICVIKDFSIMTGVKTPTVDLLLKFYERLSGHKYFEDDGSYTEEINHTGIPGINGLNTVEEIIKFYHRQ